MKRVYFISVLFLVFSQFIATGNSGASVFRRKPDDNEACYLEARDGDVTDVLQQAVNHVKDTYNFGIVYLGEGTYHISHTIYVPPAVRLVGYGKKRPVISLMENSPGYGKENTEDKGKANYMIWFTGNTVHEGDKPRDANAGTFYSAVSNVDFNIESGNPYAVILRTHYAQHCYIQHSDLHINGGKAGIFDVGNEIEDVRFFEGEYGIYTTKTSPAWQMTMINTFFRNQRKAAIQTKEGGLTIIRADIENVPVGIEIGPDSPDRIYMEGCVFKHIKDAAVTESEGGYATNQLSMRNIVFNDSPVFVRFRKTGKEIKGKGRIYKVEDFSYGLNMASFGALPEQKTECKMQRLDSMPAPVPDDIPSLPDMSEWVNIADLGAVGDDETDNTDVFRKAIRKYDVIFIPQGWYVVSGTIKLKPNTVLVGMNPVSTQIRIKSGTPVFSGFGSPVPLIESPKGGRNIISGIGLYTGSYNYRAVACKWMSGKDSYLNDVKFFGFHGSMAKGRVSDLSYSSPYAIADTHGGKDPAWDNQYWSLWITDGGGGTFNDLWSADTYASSGLYVSNTSTPARIYEMSVEHHVRNEVRFDNVSNWRVYSLQLEEETRESRDCRQMELENCSDMFFAQSYLFRVIKVDTPSPYAVRIWNCRNMEFRNFHNFTQMRYTTTLPFYDINKKTDVRPWEFTKLTVNGNEKGSGHGNAGGPELLNTGSEDEGGSELLNTGFEYAEGICHDSKGNVYFCEERMKRIYKWDASSGTLSLLADYPWAPVSLACDSQDHLIVICRYRPQPGYMIDGKQESVKELPDRYGTSYSAWGNSGFAAVAYSLDPYNPDESIRPLEVVPYSGIKKAGKILYPAHRWRDSRDFDNVCRYVPENCFVAPDGKTIIPDQYDLNRSSSLIEALPGKPLYTVDEYDHRTVRFNVNINGTLSDPVEFVCRGENGIVQDEAGNVYITDGEIYEYSPEGSHIRTITTPERPCSLTIADGYLYYTSGTSFYRVRL